MVFSHMVPYDQPEAALVRRCRVSESVEVLTCSAYLGHDYPVGQEHPLDELICISSYTVHLIPLVPMIMYALSVPSNDFGRSGYHGGLIGPR